jgi:hypothetical protein
MVLRSLKILGIILLYRRAGFAAMIRAIKVCAAAGDSGPATQKRHASASSHVNRGNKAGEAASAYFGISTVSITLITPLD